MLFRTRTQFTLLAVFKEIEYLRVLTAISSQGVSLLSRRKKKETNTGLSLLVEFFLRCSTIFLVDGNSPMLGARILLSRFLLKG